MGQKVNPISMRLQLNKDWRSKWFVDKRDYAKFLKDDLATRKYISAKLGSRASINKVEITRTPNLVTVTIATARAGVVIGRGGSGATELKEKIEKIYGIPVRINIEEVKKPDLYAKLVAENIAHQLERRISFRRAIKSSAAATMRAGAKGIRIEVAGRLNGAEMSRREKEVAGSVPLHTLRADIDYAQVHAPTVAGIIGVKVWIYKGEVRKMLLPKRQKYRKVRKGRIRGVATAGHYIAFGDYALQSQSGERITSRQIEAARQAMTRHIKRGGKIWIRVFPHTPVTRKPQDVKMGSGKGSPEFFVAKVRPGTILFEMQGVDEATAREAMRLAANKLPVKTKFLVREEG